MQRKKTRRMTEEMSMKPGGMRTYRKRARRIDTWMTGNKHDTRRDENI